MIRRSQIDLAAALRGQSDDPLRPVTRDDIAMAESSEMAHAIMQGASRGACRMVTDGRAHRMDAWVVMKDVAPLTLVSEAMPGVRVEAWEEAPLKVGKAAVLGETIRQYLSGLGETERVSTRALKQALGLGGGPDKTFQRAVGLALVGTSWRTHEKSLTREPAVTESDELKAIGPKEKNL